MSNPVIVFEGQTVMDIVMQEYGCYDGLPLFLVANPLISITDDLIHSQVLNGPDEVPQLTETNQATAAYFKLNNIRVNGGWKPEVLDFYNDDFYHTDFYN